MSAKRKRGIVVTPHEALASIMASMRQAGAGSAPGPVDSFKFGGVIWWRLETPKGNSMIVGLPDVPGVRRTRKAKP